jgi:hypothetical protein
MLIWFIEPSTRMSDLLPKSNWPSEKSKAVVCCTWMSLPSPMAVLEEDRIGVRRAHGRLIGGAGLDDAVRPAPDKAVLRDIRFVVIAGLRDERGDRAHGHALVQAGAVAGAALQRGLIEACGVGALGEHRLVFGAALLDAGGGDDIRERLVQIDPVFGAVLLDLGVDGRRVARLFELGVVLGPDLADVRGDGAAAAGQGLAEVECVSVANLLDGRGDLRRCRVAEA